MLPGMKVSFRNDNTSIHQDPDDNFVPCVNNYKDETFDDMEALPAKQTTALTGSENEELDITGVSYSCDVEMVETDCAKDPIESSSSFGDTFSGTENGPKLDGDEVQSPLHGDLASSVYDRYDDTFRMRYVIADTKAVIMVCMLIFNV